ncbi:MAG: protein serine/threonine phosphatase [Myxococcales bacterium]|nr:protein serine/threonine phosphatase [Myxococcales bacterium]
MVPHAASILKSPRSLDLAYSLSAMQELWSSTSYEPHLLSLPFAFAPAAMLVVVAYALVMRGEPVLRLWTLLHFVGLMPYSVAVMLSPSVTSPTAANAMFRIAAAFIPMAATAGAGFQLRLLGKHRQFRVFVWCGLAIATVWIFVGMLTTAAVDGVRWLPTGFWYPNAGRWAWATLVTTVGVSAPGFTLLAIAAFTTKPRHVNGRVTGDDERRQLRLVFVANLITYAALADVALAYGVGVFPLGWLLSGIGSLLVVRALIFDDLLRVRAVDTTAPQLVLHFAAAILLGWVALGMLGPGVLWWGVALVLVLCFGSVRVSIAVIGLLDRGARAGEGTLDRLLAQLVVRARAIRAEAEIAKLAIDVVELGLGVKIEILVAAAEDWGWTTASGQRIDDALAPDPLVAGWLVEQRTAIFADELEARVPGDLRALVGPMFEHHRARTIIPVTNRDELLALIVVPSAARRQRGRQLAFLERAAERFGEALVHARMAKRAADRAILAREVELAATVQAQLLPGKGPHVHGDVTVVGSWSPATRCAGDFWGVYSLGGERVLVAIGDVTGHGVASATVTAAAAAACDVAVRRHRAGHPGMETDREPGRAGPEMERDRERGRAGPEMERDRERGRAGLDLGDFVRALDAAVRRVGGGELTMTCFVAVLDGAAREIQFISCGHTTPYLCRIGSRDELELHALVGRGNPLGGPSAVPTKVQQRPLRAGDLVVWYTDGVVEAQDAAGEPFGDRRLQRMLKRLDRAHLSPPAVHDVVHASVAAHRGTTPRNDDETLVVGQWQPPSPSSTEMAKEAAT